jgi:hypothetical protein
VIGDGDEIHAADFLIGALFRLRIETEFGPVQNQEIS